MVKDHSIHSVSLTFVFSSSGVRWRDMSQHHLKGRSLDVKLKSVDALPNLPATLIIPSWRNGSSLLICLLQGNFPDFWLSRISSSWKASCCASLMRVSVDCCLSSTLKGSVVLILLANRWMRAMTAEGHPEKHESCSVMPCCLVPWVYSIWVVFTSRSPTSDFEEKP